MFKKTLTAAIAALTLAGASLTTTSAQAGGFGKFVAAGIVGAVVGGALASRSSASDSSYDNGYRPVRGGYNGGCGYSPRPVFDEYGNRVGFRRVPTC